MCVLAALCKTTSSQGRRSVLLNSLGGVLVGSPAETESTRSGGDGALLRVRVGIAVAAVAASALTFASGMRAEISSSIVWPHGAVTHLAAMWPERFSIYTLLGREYPHAAYVIIESDQPGPGVSGLQLTVLSAATSVETLSGASTDRLLQSARTKSGALEQEGHARAGHWKLLSQDAPEEFVVFKHDRYVWFIDRRLVDEALQ